MLKNFYKEKPNEQHFTPIDIVREVLKLNILRGATSLLEPCAGKGNIIRAARAFGFDWHITAIEIDKTLEDSIWESSAERIIMKSFFDSDIHPDKLGTFDAVIINPPYSNLDNFLEKAFSFLNYGGKMAALLRTSHLAGVKRGRFFAKFQPTSVHVLSQRVPFEGSKSVDIGGYCWLLFDNPLTNKDTTLHWIQSFRDDQRIFNGKKTK
jgi:predicted RNA methylase